MRAPYHREGAGKPCPSCVLSAPMTRPWQILATVPTAEGKLELRQRGENEFLIVIAGRVLMTSAARRSEEALAKLAISACAALSGRRAPRVLLGGLGMGYTLRAALDGLPPAALVTVAELNPAVVDWCRGALSHLTGAALADPRVRVEIGDVAALIARSPPGGFDGIVLDLYEGPHAATQARDDPFYGAKALRHSHGALSEGGVLAVWSEEPDQQFEHRLAVAGFAVTTHRAGKGGRSHVVYLGARV